MSTTPLTAMGEIPAITFTFQLIDPHYVEVVHVEDRPISFYGNRMPAGLINDEYEIRVSANNCMMAFLVPDKYYTREQLIEKLKLIKSIGGKPLQEIFLGGLNDLANFDSLYYSAAPKKVYAIGEVLEKKNSGSYVIERSTTTTESQPVLRLMNAYSQFNASDHILVCFRYADE